MIARLTEVGVKKETKNIQKENIRTAGIFAGSLFAVDNLNHLIGDFRQLSQTKNGFDLIGAAGSGAGEVIGAIAGGVIGAVVSEGVGTLVGSQIGAKIGSAFGGGIGDLQQRKAIARQGFLSAKNRLTAITGHEQLTGINTANAGVSLKDFITMQAQFARARGYSAGSDVLTKNAIYAERGYGVDRNTSANIVEMFRSAREGNRNLAAFIQGVIQKGNGTIFKNGDHTFLNEFLNKFSTLQKELLKTQTHVATGATMDILTKFNSIGGEFSARDPRSLGLISRVNESLKSPGSDFKKSLAFYALRRLHPEMQSADLIAEMQKGINSPGYFNSIMKFVSGMSGNENAKRLNIAGLLGLENNQKFADDLLKAWEHGKFKGLNSDQQLNVIRDMRQKAENLTTPLEKNQARIENGLLTDKAVNAMAKAFTTAVKSTLSGAVIEMEDGNKIILKSNAAIKENMTKPADHHLSKSQYRYKTVTQALH